MSLFHFSLIIMVQLYKKTNEDEDFLIYIPSTEYLYMFVIEG